MQGYIRNISLCALVFLLSGCGDGWEAVRTDTAFPYGNQRTAGSGVMYVRAKMLPQKELVVSEPAVVDQQAEKIFSDSLHKVSPSAGDGSYDAVEPSSPELQSAPETEDGTEMEPEDGAMMMEDMGTEEHARVTVPRETVFISEKEIVAPKRDLLTPAERGQITLDEIYNGVYDGVRAL